MKKPPFYHFNNKLLLRLLLCLILANFAGLSAKDNISFSLDISNIQNHIRSRVELLRTNQLVKIGTNLIYSKIMLPKFYEERGYTPAWFDSNNQSLKIDELLTVIANSDQEGLHPDDYHLELTRDYRDRIIALMNDKNRDKLITYLVELDLLLTDSFLILGSHFLGGRINPETIDPEWSAVRREVDLSLVLKQALEKNSIQQSLYELLPQHQNYRKLKDLLVKYNMQLKKQGKLTKLIFSEYAITPQEITSLRQRLQILGDLPKQDITIEDKIDEDLTNALKKYQKRHGLKETGLIDKPTIENLNIPIEYRIDQIKINMERWRWLPEYLGTKYVIVNIANFEMELFEQNEMVMNKRVIVGKHYRKTPIFSDKITHIVINPYWTVPQNLAVQDIIPKIIKDNDYLKKQNMKIFRGWGSAAVEIMLEEIDWSKVTQSNIDFYFRQDPGNSNALGRYVFRFPNKYNIFMHDTPTQDLFQENERTFSSGCIRLENPLDLVVYLLKDDPLWDRNKILKTLNEQIDYTISLTEPMPIHLVYLTAWIESDGTAQFRKDIYERDLALLVALKKESPTN